MTVAQVIRLLEYSRYAPDVDRAFALKRAHEASLELRRGLIAINGAALIASVSLLSAKLPATAVHASAWAFFWGLIASFSVWVAGETTIAMSPFVQDGRLLLLKTIEGMAPEGHVHFDGDDALTEAIGSVRTVRFFSWLVEWFEGLGTLAAISFFVYGCIMTLRAVPTH